MEGVIWSTQKILVWRPLCHDELATSKSTIRFLLCSEGLSLVVHFSITVVICSEAM